MFGDPTEPRLTVAQLMILSWIFAPPIVIHIPKEQS